MDCVALLTALMTNLTNSDVWTRQVIFQADADTAITKSLANIYTQFFGTDP